LMGAGLSGPKNPRKRAGSIRRTIRSWPVSERPREILIDKGASSLSDSQLLAILLRTGRSQASAVELALDLLARFGSLSAMSSLSVSELCAVPGVGPAKAAQLIAGLEAGNRATGRILGKGFKVRHGADVFNHYHPILRHLKKEVFRALLLDTRHRVIKDLTISTGSINLNVVHPREVFNAAVRESAAALIVVHNHPSGDPTPSPEDRELTDRLIRAGEIMGIAVLDHLVIGDGRYVSFLEQGFMKNPEPGGPSSSPRAARFPL
jgi:DNA repair protein RadC